MQTDNPMFDSMAKFFTNAAGAAQAFGAEMETMIKSRFERFIADMDFVPREEFDAVKAMASKARSENETLAKRVAALEEELTSRGDKSAPGSGEHVEKKVHKPKL